MAFIGMILALVLLGIFEVVSMFTARSNVIDATRAGARVVSLNYADNISIARVLQALDSHGQNTIARGQCDVTEIDIYEAAARNNQPAPVPAPTQMYLMYPGTDSYGGACSSQLNTASGLPPFDQTTRNILAIAAQGQAPATVGVRVYYRYHFHTPVLAAAGATFTFTL
ncbi:MAG TPA: TadE family protein, partial [Chloroflexota bacterium]